MSAPTSPRVCVPFSLCPAGPARQRRPPVHSPALDGLWALPIGPVPPEPPTRTTHASLWTSRPQCTLKSRPPPPCLFSCPVPHSLSLLPHSCTRSTPTLASLSHSTRPRSAIAVHRDLGFVPRPPLILRRVRCPGVLRLHANNSGHPSFNPFPLYSSLLALIGLSTVQSCRRRRRPEAPICSRRRSNAPGPSLEETHLPRPLIFYSLSQHSRNCS